MIPAHRFIVRSTNHDAWLAARRAGVTATSVAAVAAKKDRNAAIGEWLHPEPFDGNEYTRFGNESEPALLDHAHREHGILPSDWLIAGEVRWRLATPDGLSVDHRFIAEGKTTGDPWDGADVNPRKIPIKYRRQVQFQLDVTGADACLFVWQLRVPDEGWFRFGWWEPRTVWIERDEAMIADLRLVADDMYAVLTAGTDN